MVRASIRYALPAVLGDDIGIAAHQIHRRIRALLNYLSYHLSFLPQSSTSPSILPHHQFFLPQSSAQHISSSTESLNTKILTCVAYIQHVDIRGVPCLIHRCMAACLTYTRRSCKDWMEL